VVRRAPNLKKRQRIPKQMSTREFI
jgi:hypothetical protein